MQRFLEIDHYNQKATDLIILIFLISMKRVLKCLQQPFGMPNDEYNTIKVNIEISK